MPYSAYSSQAIAQRGEAIYEQRFRRKLEPSAAGRFLALDIESEDYEIADDDLAATKQLLAKRPAAIVYGLRIGQRSAYRLGGRFGVVAS